MKDLVYFIRSGEHVKIGVCGRGRLSERLEELQTGNPVELELLAWMTCERAQETEIHRALSHLRTRGEWFDLTPELRQAIRQVDLLEHRYQEKLLHAYAVSRLIRGL